jgi:hypothetical protein
MLVKDRVKKPYLLSDGSEVPGVTTILSILDKPALKYYYYNLGKQGRHPDSAKQQALDVGTLAHYLVETFVKRGYPEVDEGYSEKDVLKAEDILEAFKQYWEKRKCSLLHSELAMIDEARRYGGTADLIVNTDRGPELWDLKTSKAIWPEYLIQAEAYVDLYVDHDGTKIPPRIVLISKEGIFDAPDIAPEVRRHAQQCWTTLPELYHSLTRLRYEHERTKK